MFPSSSSEINIERIAEFLKSFKKSNLLEELYLKYLSKNYCLIYDFSLKSEDKELPNLSGVLSSISVIISLNTLSVELIIAFAIVSSSSSNVVIS